MKAEQEISDDRIAAAVELLQSNCCGSVHGVTPKQLATYLSVGHVKKVLADTRNTVLNHPCAADVPATALLPGLSVDIVGMTPEEYRNGGASLVINYSLADTQFGRLITASTDKGVCYMAFADDGEQTALARLSSFFPNAIYRQAADKYQQDALSVFNRERNNTDTITLHLKGTDFQLKVWRALLNVPSGCLVTYSDLAVMAGADRAQRAVGSAMAANPVIFLIPCHRVVQSSGVIGNYLYGKDRKNAMIGWEAAVR